MSRRLLVTAALPYANGPIHIGHLVEHVQTDIWVRFQRLRGHRCIFICADDTHGTATMIRARQEGRSEEAVITDMNEQHRQDFAGFDISFDQYGTTHCPENEALCHVIWARLREADLVVEREVRSADVQQHQRVGLGDFALQPFAVPVEDAVAVAAFLLHLHLAVAEVLVHRAGKRVGFSSHRSYSSFSSAL